MSQIEDTAEVLVRTFGANLGVAPSKTKAVLVLTGQEVLKSSARPTSLQALRQSPPLHHLLSFPSLHWPGPSAFLQLLLPFLHFEDLRQDQGSSEGPWALSALVS